MKAQRAQGAHRIVCGVIALILLAAMAYATAFGTVLVTAGAVACVMLAGLMLWLPRRPERWRAAALAALGMLAVGVLIHAAQGRAEAHFAVFVFLAFLPVYRDWLPIVVGAVTVCLHHLVFNLLQQWSWGPVCFIEPSFAKVAEHALYVALDAVGLIALSTRARIEMRDLLAMNATLRRALGRIRATTDALAQSARSISRASAPVPATAGETTAAASPAPAGCRFRSIRGSSAEERWATSQLAQAMSHLDEVAAEREETVRRYTEQMRLARDEAIAASHAKSAFLANMSHEIRTPLTSIIGFAELLLEPHPASADPRAALQTIVRNGRHLLEVIDDILDVAKIESQRIELEQIDLALPALLRDLNALVSASAVDRGLEFAIVPHLPLPARIRTDPVRLKQVLLNLCSNAIRFTPSGSVTLEVHYRPERPALCFTVIDTGIGMSREQVGKLFRPFVQADVSTTREYGGTGLGLYISTQLASQLGGRIVVQSEPGRGSRFELEIALPGEVPAGALLTRECELVDDERAEFQVMPVAPPALDGRVLLAEDGLDNQRLISAYLKQAGLAVSVAGNGSEAVEAALAQEFDLVLMDMQMPVMDGLTATRTLRATGYRRPIIALTANVMKEDVQRYRDAGCDDVLSKPLDRRQFYDGIARNLAAATRVPDFDADLERELAELKVDFEAGLPAQAEAIRSALQAQDWTHMATVTHMLKGTAGSFGHGELTTLAATVEAEARAGRGERAASKCEELLVELMRFTRRPTPETTT